MYKDNMFGPPCRRPPMAIVLRQVYMYVIKTSGKGNSRNTCDGYPLTGKCVQYTKYYTAYDSQH